MFKLIFLLIALSCQSLITGTTQTWQIKLDRSLGGIEIDLPVAYDTLLVWTEYSDCGDPCAHSDYRVQKRTNPVFKDNGFLYFPLKNSVFQFTIKHAKLFECLNDRDTSDLLGHFLLEKLRKEAHTADFDKLTIDTTLLIDGHIFAVVGYADYDQFQKTNVQEVAAMTMFRGNIIELYFEDKQIKKKDLSPEYIEESFRALKTLKFHYGS